ncbi:hypothetical protein D3C76_517950 [compost metagenome]
MVIVEAADAVLKGGIERGERLTNRRATNHRDSNTTTRHFAFEWCADIILLPSLSRGE